MRKYLAIFRTALQSSITWRGAFWFYVSLSFLPLIAYYYLWTAVFQNRAEAAGFSYHSLLTYAVVALLITRFTSSWPEFGVMENIREGTLTKYLVQPTSYLGYFFTSRVAFRVFANLINAPFAMLIIYVLRDRLLPPATGWQWLATMLAIPIAYVMQFLLGMLLGLVSFWISEARYLIPLKETALLFVGGMALPYAFFPAAVQTMLDALPFKYLAAFPVEIFLGQKTAAEAIAGLAVGLIWLGALFALMKLMWRRGLKKFVAVGN
ncbi:MAG: ABC-2 family transporter protein [Candidatus Kerfeldbacteria bacterium]|nr:ABC-2 family transporter protein [Candidatus Kerfeldbacteria bacterium]